MERDMATTPEQQSVLDVGSAALSTDIAYDTRVNYAMQQNAVPIIKQIKIENQGLESLRDLVVRIESEPDFTNDWHECIDSIPPGAAYRITEIDLQLFPGYLRKLDEREAGCLTLEVLQRDAVLHTRSLPVELLATREWGGLQSLPEILAAFVQPNHPRLAPLITEAAKHLEELTGTSAFSGYQSHDRKVVQAQAAAIFEALRRYEIIYVNPPASFEESGQKIRTPDQVFGQRQGSCLDLAVLMASTLEAVGLHPAVVLLQGHAMTGVWLDDETFPESCVFEAASVRKRTELEELMVMEMTLSVKGGASFTVAVNRGQENLRDDARFACLIDVSRARKSRLLPISSHALQDRDSEDGDRPGLRECLGDDFLPELKVTPLDDSGGNGEIETPEGRLERWKRRLMDLTLRNKLLNYRDNKKALPLLCSDITVLEDALADGQEFSVRSASRDFQEDGRSSAILQARTGEDARRAFLAEELESRRLYADLPEKEVERRLVECYREARSRLEESGVSGLYMAVGFLRWYETSSSDMPRESPLLLIPAEITRKSARHGYCITQGEDDTALNQTLLEMLRHDFDLEIPGLSPLPQDESGVDVGKVLQVFRMRVRDIARWEVVDKAVIGFFSFTKYLMWHDLNARTEELLKNPLVSHLIQQPDYPFGDEPDMLSPDRVDEELAPTEIFCPVDADSSQMTAVAAAAAGQTFVLHGPPGTGKSQTITNLIAHALAADKTVLFVSEKNAALDVVFERLKRIGLDRFSLELHSNKARKREVVEKLAEPLGMAKIREPAEWLQEAHALQQMREELNAYVKVLHKRHRNGLSFYGALSKLSGLRDATLLPMPWENPDQHTDTELQELREAVSQAQKAACMIGNVKDHPWFGCGREEWSPKWEHEVVSKCESLGKALDIAEASWQDAMKWLRDDDTAPSRKRLDELAAVAELLIDAPSPPARLLTCGDWENIKSQIAVWIKREERVAELTAALDPVFEADVLELPHGHLLARWRQVQGCFVGLRFLKGHMVLRSLKPFLKSGATLPRDRVREFLESARELKEEKEAAEQVRHEASTYLGRYWSVEHGEWDRAREVLEWADKLRLQAGRLTPGKLEEAAKLREKWAEMLSVQAEELRESSSGSKELRKFAAELSAFQEVLRELAELMELDEDIVWGQRDEPAFFALARTRLNRWRDTATTLRDWCYWRRARAHAGIDVPGLIDALESGIIVADKMEDTFERSYLQWWYETACEQEPLVRNFASFEHEDRIQRFRQTDQRYLELTKQLIAARLSARIPDADRAVGTSEIGVLQREAQKRRRHLSIRKLISKTRTLLPRLKPCLLMSPISIAQYLDVGQMKFDLVVFDEASQIPPWDAIGAIARGNSAVIVGDPKQLPPTSFFARSADDEYPDDEDVEDLESILDECIAARVPNLSLTWHYRSRHEDLIAFSNYHYYGNRLLTFPCATGHPLGVHWHFLPGAIYDKGKSRTNQKEAEAIVSAVVARLESQETRQQSVGIVTFNQAQQIRIEDLLDETLQQKPHLEEFFSDSVREPVFVKNLENVQGDERDIMIFSICYGPDHAGKVSMNFGPLNRDGGERRLNVAITRARQELHVYSGLQPDQIDLTRTKAQGVKDLKTFLEYADRGLAAIAQATTSTADAVADSPFEEEVCRALVAKGWTVHKQVGCSGYRIDLAVVNSDSPGRYILGIECDGATYHRASCARDRDKVRESVLRDLGWEIHRVWSTDWWHQPEREIEKIQGAIEVAIQKRDCQEFQPKPANFAMSASNEQAQPDSPYEKWATAQAGDTPGCDTTSGTQERLIYQPFRSEELWGDAQEFAQVSHDENIKLAIEKTVEKEGPICEDLLIRRVAGLWGIQRCSEAVRDRINAHVERADVFRDVSRSIRFIWPPDISPEGYLSYRVPGDDPESQRSIEQIAIEEIANAAYEVLETQLGIPAGDLARETARQLGFERTGNKIQARVMEAIMYLQERGLAT
ncbi:MAG: DUF3320 domain-containing protein [Candidatus Pacebacteria bacterium]|nr:DUF3320 domain-containing protein [Candidatus Paceibacterota bacterium]